VETALILETTFLVDLERESLRRKHGPAVAFLQVHSSTRLYVTFTIAGELAAGSSLSQRADWQSFLQPFHMLLCTEDVCWQYGEIYRYLDQNGRLIGSNDLWIAATALANHLPLVSRNVSHFKRIPHLELVRYYF
jgi:tRNA(fMet)-specific endonuclease VapC